MTKNITMSLKEVRKYDVIKRMLNGKLNGTQAAKLLDLTTRQIRRLKAKVKKKGVKGLVHGNRGKPGNRNIPEREKEKIIKLLHERYADFKPGFAAEKLAEEYGIKRDGKTIRKIMIEEQLWKARQKKDSPYFAQRERKANYGEMVQYDGSYEKWFEGRGEKCCLLASIDDATSEVYAFFDEHEGVFPTYRFWENYIKRKGKPFSIYVDRFSTYSMNQELAAENDDTLTQFQRALADLDIKLIKAHTPQAKGRVERLFGTLQDRLIKEMRLKNISTKEEANVFLEKTFLPAFNRKFMVKPAGNANLHRKLTKKEESNLPSIFSRKYTRVVRNDFTLTYKNTWFQLGREQPVTVCKKDLAVVEEFSDGTLKFKLNGKYLNFTELPEKPKKQNVKVPWVLAKTSNTKPAKDHPWRKFNFSNKLTKMSK